MCVCVCVYVCGQRGYKNAVIPEDFSKLKYRLNWILPAIFILVCRCRIILLVLVLFLGSVISLLPILTFFQLEQILGNIGKVPDTIIRSSTKSQDLLLNLKVKFIRIS